MEEQEHFDSLGMVLKGDVPNVSAARSGMEGYTPSESYAAGNNSEEKKHDQFYVPTVLQQKTRFIHL